MLVVGVVRLVVGTIRRVSNALRTRLHRNTPLGPPRISPDPTPDLGFRLWDVPHRRQPPRQAAEAPGGGGAP